MDRGKVFSGSESKRFGTPNRKVNIWDQVDVYDIDGVKRLTQPQDAAILGIEGISVFDQQRLEQGMMERMDHVVKHREKVLQQKRASRELKRVELEIRQVKLSIARYCQALDVVNLNQTDKETKRHLESVNCHKLNKEKQLKTLQAKLERLQKLAGLDVSEVTQEDEPSTSEVHRSPVSTSTDESAPIGESAKSKEELIKLGHMTPFGSMLDDVDTEKQLPVKQKKKLFLDDSFNDFLTSQSKPKRKPEKAKTKPEPTLDKSFKIPKKKKKLNGLKSWINDTSELLETMEETIEHKDSQLYEAECLSKRAAKLSDSSDQEYIPDLEEIANDVEDLEEEEMMSDKPVKKKMKQPRYDPESGLAIFDGDKEDDSVLEGQKIKLKRGTKPIIDDGKVKNYTKRIDRYRNKLKEELSLGLEVPEDKDLGGGLKVPGRVWSKLYKYQRTGVRWLWELHTQNVGGILGDEMGLGKTIQVISFLAALQQSRVRSRGVLGHGYDGLGPVLIITPTTVMHQWVREIHTWWPPFRTAILHDSGTYEGSRSQLVENIAAANGILITSYERARINIEMLMDHGWHYVILDEGHKIRNPEAGVTTALKLFRTPHRIILSGSPVQNNLRELWSLFDFIFPGKLGTLPVFMEQFSVPIVQGGYSNATEVQVHTAYKCACKLRDTISPYLLRRMKRDVQATLDLPAKNEQVLFCRLSKQQVDVYKQYLESDAVHSILCREMKVFAGLIQLRKICNHPDLFTGGPKLMVGEPIPSPHNEKSFGYHKRSGKMQVVSSLLKIWKKQGNKVLLFSQSKAMLDILEVFVKSRGYTYFTLHGGTPVQSRQALIRQFNEDESIFVFLLTTRVGGLGVNLTGANRVVIFDPDWNPSTDSQAQERSWRIGQKRDVTIYRLLTSGTIEEKIYHRQIFKQFLTNRILKDPWQRRFFKSNDLHELFILKDHTNPDDNDQVEDSADNCKTETAAIFAGIGSEVKPNNTTSKKREKFKAKSPKTQKCISDQVKSPAPCTVSECRKTSAESTLNDFPESHFRVSVENKAQAVPDENSVAKLPQVNTAENNSLSFGYSGASSSSSVAQRIHCDTGSNEDIRATETTPLESHRVSSTDINFDRSRNSLSTSLKESLIRAKLKFEERKRVERLSSNGKIKKNKRSKKDPVVDGEIVANVAAIETYKSAKDRKEMEKKNRKATDDYVLERLFKRARVHSALQHNAIMDSAHPDFALVEVEAERVAKESVRNLKLSRREYRFPGGQPSSQALKRRFGKKLADTSLLKVEKDDCALIRAGKNRDNLFKALHHRKDSEESVADVDSDQNSSNSGSSGSAFSASQLLSSMRRRNHEQIHKQEALDAFQLEEENDMFGMNISEPELRVSLPNPTEHDELLRELRNFIAFQCEVDGQAKTSEIMAEFENKVDPAHAAIFKSILKEICASQNVPGLSEKLWTLKPEFQ